MFFRRKQTEEPSLGERVELLKQAGFKTETQSDGRFKISKHGVGAVIGEEGQGQLAIERAGILAGSEIAVLLSAGYQMFLELPSGRRLPATATELTALHEFEEDVKEALGLTSLFNTSLGTTSRKHMYDRVTARDTGHQPKPWERAKASQAKPIQ